VLPDEVEDAMLEKYKDWRDRNYGQKAEDAVK